MRKIGTNMNSFNSSSALFFGALAAVCALCCPPALAQGAAGKTAANQVGKANPEAIRARAAQVKEFQKLMNDPDATVRLSALDSMLNHDDILIRDMGFEIGFASADTAVRALCLRTKLFQSKNLIIEVGDAIDSSGKRARESATGSTFTLQFREFDLKTGNFDTPDGGKGKVSGTQLTWSNSDNTLQLRLQDGAALKGNSKYRHGKPFDVTASLM